MIAVLFNRCGPYHNARLKALSEVAKITVIEFSTFDNTYSWDIVKPDSSYPTITLFEESNIDCLPIGIISKQIDYTLKKIKPTVVAIPGWSSPASLAALAWCKKNRTPTILMSDSTEHDEPRQKWKEWIKSHVVRMFSSALVAGSKHAEYVEKLGMQPNSVFTGYDVVDNAYFQQQADKVQINAKKNRIEQKLPSKYFLASNRFIKKKNISFLIDAYAIYRSVMGKDAWDLVLLGDGPLMMVIRQQVAKLGLTSFIHFPGFKQYDDLPKYYGLASAFILASTSEQWGLVVNEAMACGLPVAVSSCCGCAPDLVQEGLNGFVFDPYDLESLANLMLKLSDNECDLTSMGRHSQSIISSFTPLSFAEGIIRAADAATKSLNFHYGCWDRFILFALSRRKNNTY